MTLKKWMRVIIFFIIGLSLAIFTECFRFYIVEQMSPPWISMTIGYLLILSLAFLTTKLIKNNLLYYLFFGFLGIILEIFIFKQLPNILSVVLSVGILGWIMWFSFWGGLVLIPKLYFEKNLSKFTIYFLFISLVLFFIFYLLTKNNGWIGLFFTSLNIPFFIQFFKDFKRKLKIKKKKI